MSGHPLTASEIRWGQDQPDPHTFERAGERRYRLLVPECATTFDVDRIYRDRQELCGELVVSSQIKGAKTFEGNLFSGNVNLSSAYRRRDVAQRLRDRANTRDTVDWDGLLDELGARVVKAEREGQPPRLLSTYDRPSPDDAFNLEGIVLPQRHPSILFGDGGTFKSFLGLFVAGWLAQQGVRVLFADWELDAGDHRLRLEQLFGQELPPVFYARYQRPLVDEVDGIRRFVADQRIAYVICDSVGYATNGAPENAEAAMAYFRAVRQFGAGVGSLHLAHVTKPKEEAPDPAKPFGSVFWHNSARSTWYVKRTTDPSEPKTFSLAVIHRKANLGALLPAVGLEIAFEGERTTLRRINVADVDEFASALPISSRIVHALRGGLRTIAELETETGAKADTIRRTLNRGKGKAFVCTTDGADGVHRWGNIERREYAS